MNIFEITIQKRKESSWPIETKLTRSYDSLPVHHKGELKLSKQDFNELTSLKIQSQQYGQFLGIALFQGEIYQAYLQALDSSWDGIRVLLIVEDKELEVLYWHWLCAPQEWNFISLNQRCCFSISLKTPTERVFPPINQNDLKALILAASPQGLEEYSLASFNVQETVDSLKIALGQIPTDVLAVDGGLGMPTLDELCDRLTQTSYSLLHIVGHGQVQRGETFLYWATKENLVWPVEGSKLIERLQNIQNLPHFIFLSACETAKSEAGMALGGLAQRMVRELGIPAVLAMTENVTIETAALLSKAFYPRLRKHGEVDKALVEATSTLSRDDILVPALFSRLGSRSLFTLEPELDISQIEIAYITYEIYQHFINEKKERDGKNRQPDHWNSYKFAKDDATKPIAGVRASDAKEFCNWLNKQYSRSGERYRLPSQVEEFENYLGEEVSIGYWCNTKEKYKILGIQTTEKEAWKSKASEILKETHNQDKLYQDIILALVFALEKNPYEAKEFADDINLNGIVQNILRRHIDWNCIVDKQIEDGINADVMLSDAPKLYLTNFKTIAKDHHIDLNRHFSNIPDFNLKLLFNDAPKIDAAIKQECKRELNRELRYNRNSSYSRYYWLLIYAILHLLSTVYKKAVDYSIWPSMKKNRHKLSCNYATLREKAFNIYIAFVLINERRRGNISAWEGIRVVKEKL